MSVFKKKQSARLMMFVLLSLFAIGALNVRNVKAASLTINISPSSAPVGSTVTISGTNATPNGEIRMYVYGIFFASTIADESGNYSINLTVPVIPANSFQIFAYDIETGEVASAFFTVEPRIILTPTIGSPYDTVTVRGDGFEDSSNITIYFDGIDVTPSHQPQTDHFGSFEATFTVPSRPNGNYTVTVQSQGHWLFSASAEFTIIPKITFWPQSSGVQSMRMISGYGYASSVDITVYFGAINITPLGTFQTNPNGEFSFPFFIPQVDNGVYMVNASDAAGNWAVASFIVGSPMLSLVPSRISTSSMVKAVGTGFPMNALVVLYLENVTMTNIIDLMWVSESLLVDESGSFEYSFMVPITEPGTYNVSAYYISGPDPSMQKKVASALLTIVDDSPLSIELDVGEIHFRGEIAEFYATISHNGRLVNATIDKAVLYHSEDASSYNLTVNVKQVDTGVYQIPYTLPSTASVGTYTLVIEASYSTPIVESYGASSASFLVSPTLTSQNAQVAAIENNITTIIIPDLGTIKANLTVLDAKLTSLNGTMATIQTNIVTINTNIANIQARVTSIDGSVATIQTILGTLQGNVTSINGKIATIQTDIGTVQMDISDLASEITPSHYEISLTTLVLALIAAACAMLAVALLFRKKAGLPQPSSSPTPPQQPSPPQPPSPQGQT